MDKYKARLVVLGNHQTYGVNYWDVYSPTLKYATIRILLHIAAQEGLWLYQWDIGTSFLNAELKEDVYIQIPDGFDKYPGYCWK